MHDCFVSFLSLKKYFLWNFLSNDWWMKQSCIEWSNFKLKFPQLWYSICWKKMIAFWQPENGLAFVFNLMIGFVVWRKKKKLCWVFCVAHNRTQCLLIVEHKHFGALTSGWEEAISSFSKPSMFIHYFTKWMTHSVLVCFSTSPIAPG